MSRTSVILLVLAIVFLGMGYYCGTKSVEWETHRLMQETKESGFTVFPGNPELNWWDAGNLGFLITGGSCAVTAFWKRKG